MNEKPNCTRYDGRSLSYKRVQLGFSFIPQRNEKSDIQFLLLIFPLDFLKKFNLIRADKC